MFKVFICLVSGASLLAVSVSGLEAKVHKDEDLTCSEKNPCDNGGTCIDISEPSSNWTTRRCQCQQGFVGVNCEDKMCSYQHNESCYNDGFCILNFLPDQNNYCKCKGGFSGERCPYWILITDFDTHINMTLESRDIRITEGEGANNTKKYAEVKTNESLTMSNNYLGTDGREFCLSFAYFLSGSDATLEIYTWRRRLSEWSTTVEYIIQKKVLWASYNTPYTPADKTMEAKVGESGSVGIDEIRAEYGPCK